VRSDRHRQTKKTIVEVASVCDDAICCNVAVQYSVHSLQSNRVREVPICYGKLHSALPDIDVCNIMIISSVYACWIHLRRDDGKLFSGSYYQERVSGSSASGTSVYYCDLVAICLFDSHDCDVVGMGLRSAAS
jgi:hypothetical protein